MESEMEKMNDQSIDIAKQQKKLGGIKTIPFILGNLYVPFSNRTSNSFKL